MWRSRQNSMDAALLAAIRRADTPVALEWVKAGANPNAETWIGPPSSPETLVKISLCVGGSDYRERLSASALCQFHSTEAPDSRKPTGCLPRTDRPIDGELS